LIEQDLDRRPQAGVGKLAVENGQRAARPPVRSTAGRQEEKERQYEQSFHEVLLPLIGSIS
jgi:hypothetical protein